MLVNFLLNALAEKINYIEYLCNNHCSYEQKQNLSCSSEFSISNLWEEMGKILVFTVENVLR